jgi:beta-RFAP synthase
MSRLRLTAPSRLHFGLFSWGPDALRQFGGIGLMIDRPGLEIVAEPAEDWAAEGPLAERALAIAREVAASLGERGRTARPASLRIVQAPPEHVGLGSGTQLSLAVARIVSELAGCAAAPIAELTGRGRRSGVGLHGFAQGGLIVDGGRRGPEGLPPLLVRMEFPTEWHALIVIPPGQPGLHGSSELEAFARLPSVPDAVTDRLCRLVLLGLLPAVAERDLTAFGAALTAVQLHVGRLFAPAQGGRLYASPEAEAILAHLRSEGLAGCGQSSWGPALYAFDASGPERRAEILRRVRERFHLGPDRVFWAAGSHAGARLERLP